MSKLIKVGDVREVDSDAFATLNGFLVHIVQLVPTPKANECDIEANARQVTEVVLGTILVYIHYEIYYQSYHSSVSQIDCKIR